MCITASSALSPNAAELHQQKSQKNQFKLFLKAKAHDARQFIDEVSFSKLYRY